MAQYERMSILYPPLLYIAFSLGTPCYVYIDLKRKLKHKNASIKQSEKMLQNLSLGFPQCTLDKLLFYCDSPRVPHTCITILPKFANKINIHYIYIRINLCFLSFVKTFLSR